MEYPQEFSSQARAAVEAERLRAGRDLEQYRNRPETRPRRRHAWELYGRRWSDDEEDVHEYILRVFLVFAREACELGRQGTWAVDRIRSKTDEFLRIFTFEAYYEKGHDRSGHKFRDMVSNWGGLLPEVELEFQKSEVWHQFEEELLAVAERQADGALPKPGMDSASGPDGIILQPERRLTQNQQDEIAVAERELTVALLAHERMRELVDPGEWQPVTPSPNVPTMAGEIRKLERDIKKCAIAILRVLAEASWPLGSVELFRNRLETDARDIVARVRAKVNPKDLPLLDQTALETALNGVVSEWIRKAQREFPPPWNTGAPTDAPTGMPEHIGSGSAEPQSSVLNPFQKDAGAIRMGRPARYEIEKFANDAFASLGGDSRQGGAPGSDDSSWEDLARDLKHFKHSGEPLRAEWCANKGSEDYGIWLLRPGGLESEEARATFSLIAARAISKLGILPIPLPEPPQHDPHWTLYCQVEEEMARLAGKTRDLSDAVPYGLGKVDWDAVDPCTRAWLELLRQESPAFRISGNVLMTIKGKVYATLHGTIDDVCGASAVYCLRRARDEIGSRLKKRPGPTGTAADLGAGPDLLDPEPRTTAADDANRPDRRVEAVEPLLKPALPLEMHESLMEIKRRTQRLLEGCRNVAQAAEILRTFAVETFDKQAEYYGSLVGRQSSSDSDTRQWLKLEAAIPQWLDEIADETVTATLALLPDSKWRPRVEKELQRTLATELEDWKEIVAQWRADAARLEFDQDMRADGAEGGVGKQPQSELEGGDGIGAASEQPGTAVFGSNRVVTIVRHAGTPEETRWNTRMGGDFRHTALFHVQDRVKTGDEIHCELFDEPRVIARIDPVLMQQGVAHWKARIMPRSAWNRLHEKEQAGAAPVSRPAGRYVPRYMHHATKAPVMVYSEQEECELGPEWSREYIYQSYPKCKYHWNGTTVTVKNLDEEVTLGGGWANTPAAFDPYKGARPANTKEQDPVKWVNEWSVPGLSDNHRTKIKAQLYKADGSYWKEPDGASADTDAMRRAFDGIARVLFDTGLLTEQILKVDLTALVWDSAIAGGWWRLASETPQSIFPEKIGHYWVWLDGSRDWQGLFRSETAEWLARLLEVAPMPPVSPDQSNLLPAAASVTSVEVVQEPELKCAGPIETAAGERPASFSGGGLVGVPEGRLSRFMQEHPGTTFADIKYSATVHTPDFQDWRKGKLKPDSVMSERIEKVLAGATPLTKKPPKPRPE